MSSDSHNSDQTFEGQNLEWLAHLYVSGELDATKEAAFEERLLVDVTACEAVAAAQAMVSLVREVKRDQPAVGEVVPVSARPAGGSLVRRWVGVAAMVTLVGGVMMLWPRGKSPVVSNEADLAVVAAWTAGADALAEQPSVDDPVMAENAAHELDIPGWLVTALEHEAADDEAMEN